MLYAIFYFNIRCENVWNFDQKGSHLEELDGKTYAPVGEGKYAKIKNGKSSPRYTITVGCSMAGQIGHITLTFKGMFVHKIINVKTKLSTN